MAADEIDRMVGVLAHWQPDRIGRWHDGPAALGHLALWNTPEAVTEICPFREPASGLVVTADARIDNRDELIPALGLGSRPAAEIGDVELIGRAYLKWGEACLDHLLGDFAFGIWDPRTRRMFCARDPMGMRTFFYFAEARAFFFGTEVKAMLSMPEVPRDEEPARFTSFVAGLGTGDITRFRAIRLLPPAHTLTVDESRVVLRRYWSLDPEREIRFPRDEDYVEAFEEIFQRAIDARLRSPGRVGCMLSGGLDATTMLSFALRSRTTPRDRLTGYTWALREGDDWRTRDERPFVDEFLRENAFDHHYLVLNSERIFEPNPAIEHLQDGPILDFRHCMMTANLAHARARGIKAVLMGDGGDETASYGGRDYFFEMLFRLDWRGLRREAQAWGRARHAPERQIWKSHILRPLVLESLRGAPFLPQRSHRDFLAELRDPAAAGIPLNPALVRETRLVERYAECRPRFGWSWRHAVRCNQIDMLTGSYAQGDLATSSSYATLFGIEGRLPYLDRRVIEFCVGVPLEQHRRDGVGRMLLRRAADRRIPAKIARRPGKSSTWPDILRGVGRNEASLRASFSAWGKNPRVAAFLDVGQMHAHLETILEIVRCGESKRRLPLGMFCRAVAVGMFLQNERQ